MKVTRPDGSVEEFTADGAKPEEIAAGTSRRMDCLDCHNVVAHRIAPTPEEAVDAHSIQPYYTVLLAEEAGMELDVAVSPEEIVFTARMAAVAE